MKTVELDLEKEQKPHELLSFINRKKIKFGEEKFQLVIYSYYDMNPALYASFLLLLAKYFSQERNKYSGEIKNGEQYYDKLIKTYYDSYFKNYDTGKLENKIEKDFKIDIAFEKKNPLEEVFGIWKNENVNLEAIRKKAWQREK